MKQLCFSDVLMRPDVSSVNTVSVRHLPRCYDACRWHHVWSRVDFRVHDVLCSSAGVFPSWRLVCCNFHRNDNQWELTRSLIRTETVLIYRNRRSEGADDYRSLLWWDQRGSHAGSKVTNYSYSVTVVQLSLQVLLHLRGKYSVWFCKVNEWNAEEQKKLRLLLDASSQKPVSRE